MQAAFVLESSAPTGTLSYALAGTPAGSTLPWRSFVQSRGSGSTWFYTAISPTTGKWEEGWGVVTDGSPTDALTRNPLRSWDGTAVGTDLVDWQPGDGTIQIYTVLVADAADALLNDVRGTARPAWLPAGKVWTDTSGGVTAIVRKYWDGAQDIPLWTINETANTCVPSGALPSAGGTLSGPLAMSGAAINEAQGADIASAGTINLDTATGNLVDVTGTTGVNAITLSQGRERTVRFTGVLTLTHGANLVLPNNGSDITTAAGDTAKFRGYASSVVRCVSYTRANGTALQATAPPAAASQAEQEAASSTSVYVSPGRQHFHPSAAKAWVSFDVSGGIGASYNVSSITDTGTGDWTVNIGTDFSSVSYSAVAQCFQSGSTNRRAVMGSQAAGTFQVRVVDGGGGSSDPSGPIYFQAFGDQ